MVEKTKPIQRKFIKSNIPFKLVERFFQELTS